MRYLLLVIFLAAATIAPAQQYPTAAELLAILTELQQGIAESNRGLEILNEGLIQVWQGERILKGGIDLSHQGLEESKKQGLSLRGSFDDYRQEASAKIKRMEIAIVGVGVLAAALGILAVLFAIP
mgnify:CR=1 FL=1